MFFQHLSRWLHGRGARSVAATLDPTVSVDVATPSPSAPPLRPAAEAPTPSAPPAAAILKVDEQLLERDRQAVSQLQHDTFQRIRRLQGDIHGVATRHADARVSGRPAEKAALVRIFAGLKMQLGKAEQFHADLMNHRQLLDNLAATREFAVLRHRLQQGVLAGVGFAELRRLVDSSLANELHERNQTTELVREWARHDEDATLQSNAGYVEAEDELSLLSEAEYQHRAQAQMQPLEALADRVDQGLQQSVPEPPAPVRAVVSPRPDSERL